MSAIRAERCVGWCSHYFHQRILSLGSKAALESRFSHGSFAREMGTQKKVQHLVRCLLPAPNA